MDYEIDQFQHHVQTVNPFGNKSKCDLHFNIVHKTRMEQINHQHNTQSDTAP